jgi:hypothetical protein
MNSVVYAIVKQVANPRPTLHDNPANLKIASESAQPEQCLFMRAAFTARAASVFTYRETLTLV